MPRRARTTRRKPRKHSAVAVAEAPRAEAIEVAASSDDSAGPAGPRRRAGTGPLPVASVRPVGSIRLVAVDLDGTLLDSRKQISGRTVRALAHLPEIDVQLIIASARPPRSVRHIYKHLGLSNLQINYNGALIWDEPAGQARYHRPIDGPTALEIIRTARRRVPKVVVCCEILDRWYTDTEGDRGYRTENGRLFNPDVVAPLEVICGQPVTKIFFLGPPDAIRPLPSLIRQGFGEEASVLLAQPDLIQVMDRRVGKSHALRRVCRHYGIRQSEVLAIGDAPNDVGMMRFAGLSVAVENSYDVVKEVADWIAPSNDDHGVFAALQRYGLTD